MCHDLRMNRRLLSSLVRILVEGRCAHFLTHSLTFLIALVSDFACARSESATGEVVCSSNRRRTIIRVRCPQNDTLFTGIEPQRRRVGDSRRVGCLSYWFRQSRELGFRQFSVERL